MERATDVADDCVITGLDNGRERAQSLFTVAQRLLDLLTFRKCRCPWDAGISPRPIGRGWDASRNPRCAQDRQPASIEALRETQNLLQLVPSRSGSLPSSPRNPATGGVPERPVQNLLSRVPAP